MVDLKRYLNFLVDNKLTPRQFLFMHCLYESKTDATIRKLMGQFTESSGVMIKGRKRFLTDEERQDILDRGFVSFEGDGTKASQYQLLSPFLDAFIDDWLACQELCFYYPGFTTINGNRIPLTVANREELRKEYYSAIRGSKTKHQEIVETIEWAKGVSLINMNIMNFVQSHGWEKLRQEKQENDNSINRNYHVSGDF